MKVLHLISSGGMYGAEAVILNLSRGLREQGHTSEIGLFLNGNNPNLQLEAAALRDGTPTYRIICRGQLDRTVPAQIRALVASTGASLIHAHGYKADLYAAMAMRGRQTPVLSTCHTWYDNTLAVRLYGALDRLALRLFPAVVAVSDEVRARLLRAGVRPERVHLIGNGIDIRLFAATPAPPREAAEGPLTVGLVGRLAPEKGVDLFLRAIAGIRSELSLVRFIVVGDGPERATLEQLRDKLDLNGLVTLSGRSDQMPAIYASLDVMVSASRQEGMPMALLEGMASARPIIATTVGEVPALIRDQETGLLVEPGDSTQLGRAILSLLTSSADRHRLGVNARAFVEEHFSAAKMTAAYLSLYRRVLGEDGAGFPSSESAR